MSAFPARGPVSDAADFGNWLSGGDQPAKKGKAFLPPAVLSMPFRGT